MAAVTIRQWIAEARAQRRERLAELAIKSYSRLQAEAEFHRCLCNWYTDRVAEIDPHADWNGFAAMKQKEHDHGREFQAYSERAAQALAVADKRSKQR
jgi:hypothetical protein